MSAIATSPAAMTEDDVPFIETRFDPGYDRRVAVVLRQRRLGNALSSLAVLLLAADGAMKLVSPAAIGEVLARLGWTPGAGSRLGVVELVLLALYLMPRTATWAAVLWTGYLGGAVATYLQNGAPLLSHVLFPVYLAALLWGGLLLRDRTLRQALPPWR